MKDRLVQLLLAGLLGIACLPEDAGYGDVRKLVAQRTGHDLRGKTDLRKLTVERAVELALRNNPDALVALEELGIARADAVRVMAVDNPSAEVGLKLGGGKQARWDVAVTQDVVSLLFLPQKHAIARGDLDAAKLAVGGRLLDIALDARRDFLRLQAAEQSLALRRTVLMSVRASSEASGALHDAGNISDLDHSSQQALFEEARLAVAEAEAELAAQREKVRALLGLWGEDGDFTVEGTLAEPDDTPLDALGFERVAIERSVDLALARQRFTSAARRANLARAQGVIPELRAGAGAEREDGRWSVGPLVEVELPLFDQGQAEVGRARAEMRREERRHRALAVKIRARVRAATTRAEAARQRARHYGRTLVPLRARVLRETELQYNAMNAGIFQLLQAKRDHVEAERSRVAALRDYWIAKAELNQLLAGRLVDPSESESVADAPRAATGGH